MPTLNWKSVVFSGSNYQENKTLTGKVQGKNIFLSDSITQYFTNQRLNKLQVEAKLLYCNLHLNFDDFHQQNMHAFRVRVASRSSRPLKNDLIARCSAAYVM